MSFNFKNYIQPDNKIQTMINNGEDPDVIKTTQMEDRGIYFDKKKYVIAPSTFITYANTRTVSKENNQGIWFYNYKDNHYDLLESKKYQKIFFTLITEVDPTWWNLAMQNSYLAFFVNQVRSFSSEGTEEGILQFNNGVFIFEEQPARFVEPSPEYNCQFRIPYDYDENADCPKFKAFLTDILSGDNERIKVVQEIMGATLYYCKCMQNLIIFKGEGSNGKSLLASIIKYMLGTDNVSSVSLDKLSGGQFSRQNLDKKLLNVSSEVIPGKVYSTADLKALTGGDSVEVEKKYQNSYTTEIYSKFILLANEMIQTADYSDGFYRRLVIIPFNEKYEKTLPGEEKIEGVKYQDVTLEDDLKEELPGIFNFAYEGLMRLVDQDYQLTYSSACEKALEHYKNEHNVVKAFLNEAVNVSGNNSDIVRSSDIFPAFDVYCRDNHYFKQLRSTTKHMFFKMFEQAIDDMNLPIFKKKHSDSYYYTGMILK